MAQAFVAALLRIKRVLRRFEPPFVAIVGAAGTVTVIMDAKDTLARPRKPARNAASRRSFRRATHKRAGCLPQRPHVWSTASTITRAAARFLFVRDRRLAEEVNAFELLAHGSGHDETAAHGRLGVDIDQLFSGRALRAASRVSL